jgi:hypothetical protein
MSRERNDAGQYADGIDPDTVADVFDARDDLARPVTATDVVDELGIARRTAHNKLNALVERGELETRKIGARGRVWWRPIPAEESEGFDAGDLRGEPSTTLDDTDADDAARTSAPGDATKTPADDGDAESGRTRDESDAVDLATLSFDRDLTPPRREQLREWLRYATDHDGGVSKSDFEAWWTDDRAEKTGYNAGSFWEIFAKAAMKQSDHFTKPNTRTYRYDEGEI